MAILKPKENTIKIRCRSKRIFAHLTRIVCELEEYLNEFCPKDLYINIAGDRQILSCSDYILKDMLEKKVIRAIKYKKRKS